jgi:hypothetical protein
MLIFAKALIAGDGVGRCPRLSHPRSVGPLLLLSDPPPNKVVV